MGSRASRNLRACSPPEGKATKLPRQRGRHGRSFDRFPEAFRQRAALPERLGSPGNGSSSSLRLWLFRDNFLLRFSLVLVQEPHQLLPRQAVQLEQEQRVPVKRLLAQ